jgi:outer membrane protein TolC
MKRISIIALMLPWFAWGQTSIPSLLPPVAKVQEALLGSAQIQAARHRLQAMEARAQQQALGAYEFGVRWNQQSRHVQDPTQTFGETQVTLERPLRWWNKGQTDQALSQQSRTIAQVSYSDALHESSRHLLSQWFSAWRSRVILDSGEAQWQLAKSLDMQAAARLRQGEISRLDADLAHAEWQRVSVLREAARSEWTRAQMVLGKRYPGLGEPGPLPDLMQLSALEPVEVLREDFLRKHHELNLMRAERDKASLTAQRQEQERLPDPTVGIFSARERMGNERVLGVSIGFPLPGASRQWLTTAAQADASAWTDRVRQAELELGTEFDRRWLSARDLRQGLLHMAQAARIQQAAAHQAWRAYALGEGTMTEVLQHRRWADEQQKSLQLMQLDLLEQLAFIELDLHRLWDLD